MSYQQQAVREWAWIEGQFQPDREWLCSNYDTWERNPHYRGAPGRHPEDDQYDGGWDGLPPDEPEMPF